MGLHTNVGLHVQQYACMHVDRHTHTHTHTYVTMWICAYTVLQIFVRIYIYICWPPETYRFRFFIVFFTMICVGFCLQSSQHFFLFIWRLCMLEHDESWCFMSRYNDIFWWYLRRFRLPYCVPNKGFQFKHWQNAHGSWKYISSFPSISFFPTCKHAFLIHIPIA